MKKPTLLITAVLVAASLSVITFTPANAAGCGKAGPSCRSTIWYNKYK